MTNVCLNGPGSMTKMVTTTIKDWGCSAYHVGSNGDPRMTLTYFKTRSNFIPNAIKWKKQ